MKSLATLLLAASVLLTSVVAEAPHSVEVEKPPPDAYYVGRYGKHHTRYEEQIPVTSVLPSTTAVAPTATSKPAGPFIAPTAAPENLIDRQIAFSAIAILVPSENSTVKGTLYIDEYVKDETESEDEDDHDTHEEDSDNGDHDSEYQDDEESHTEEVDAKLGRINVTLVAEGLVPNTIHAVHIHAFGDVTSKTGANAFGHYNPFSANHSCIGAKNGAVKVKDAHVGDLGNVVADAEGKVHVTFLRSGARLGLGKRGVIGRGVVVHAKSDDCTTQPTGAAGDRYAVGVIGYKNATLFPSFEDADEDPTATADRAAVAVLFPTFNNTVTGIAYLRQKGPGYPTEISITVKNLAPNSTHGWHIHNYGDVSEKAGLAAGLHFNPTNSNHSCPGVPAPPTAGQRRIRVVTKHAGDLGNIVANAEGVATAKISTRSISLYKDNQFYALGRGLIIHADPDDCKTQPTGNSGKRLAQAVIGYRNATLVDTF
ncbi:hypothetical protein HDU97_004356 [Phlyctochytrium planicorne]|nr:hypothetical protein HDU97_004356 [Phlyctochytrium planicorne]